MRRTQRERAAWLAGVLVAAVLAAGCGFAGHHDSPVAAPVAVQPSDTAGTSGPYEEEPPGSEPVTPSPKPTRKATKKPKPRATSATPTEDPNNFQEPACAEHEGAKVSKAKAKAALVAAAGRTYWPTSAPKLKLSSDLVKSVAWHESGWQSDIVNCDGGRGLMQVMPETQTMINGRFGQSYDARDYRQNAVIGANYLAWLTKYFGDKFFAAKYDLSPSRCRTHSSTCLLNMVIASYNAGFGEVESAYHSKRLPNPEYVDSVRSLMTSCYCDRY